ncbi:MAG: tetratricopeptide repeat protein, partial [Chlorobi bacterium]|nr:tetratricopeptide repeat protein [Chlorobiota bacterium]
MPRSIKYLIGVGYFIFAGIYLPAQTVLEKDGLLHYLNLNKNDTLTVAALNKLSEYYLYKNIDSAVIYAERAEILAERFEYDAGLSEAYRNLGKVYAISGHYEKSFAYFHKAIKKNEESGDYVSLGKNYTNLGVILYYQENIEQATNYYKKALKIFSDYGYKEGLAKVYNNLGLLYADVGKTDTAIIYLHRAIKLSDITGDKNVKNNASGNLAHLLLREKDYENAVKMYLKVAESLADTEDNNLKSSVYSNIADAYLRLSDTEKDKRKAEKDLEKALMYAEKSLRKAEELNSNSLRVFSYKMLFRIYKKTGDYESAAKYSEKFIQYGDSVFNAEKTEIIAEIEAEYNNKKKQLLIENLRKEKESDLKLIKRKNQIIYITEAGLLLVTVLSLFLFILYKGKKRALKLLDEKNKAITAQR